MVRFVLWPVFALLLKDEGVIIRHLLVLSIHSDDLREDLHPNLHVSVRCAGQGQVPIREVKSDGVRP